MSLVIAAEITRANIPVPTTNLSLNDSTNYKVISAGPGALVWRRETAQSTFVHGRVLIGAVIDVEIAPLSIRVKGNSASQLNTNLSKLVEAFSQFSYFLGLTIDSVSWIWLCEPADITVGSGGEFQKFHMEAKQHEVTLQIPRDPIPTAGSI